MEKPLLKRNLLEQWDCSVAVTECLDSFWGVILLKEKIDSQVLLELRNSLLQNFQKNYYVMEIYNQQVNKNHKQSMYFTWW